MLTTPPTAEPLPASLSLSQDTDGGQSVSLPQSDSVDHDVDGEFASGR